MKRAAKWPRLLELALLLAGISLLGVVFAATAQRWTYQAREERAFFLENETGGALEAPPVGSKAKAAKSLRVTPSATVQPAHDPLVLGRLEIPRLGVKAMIREGDDNETLALAVGHLPSTVRPGEVGNAVLAGHRDTFFGKLRKVRTNDRILVFGPRRILQYRVTSTRVVAPDEVSVLASRGTEELTLVTCFPFDYIGRAPKRFVVRAARIEPPPMAVFAQNSQPKKSSKHLHPR